MELKGADELIKKLKRLQGKDAKAVVRKGLREGAKVIQKQAQDNVPVRSGTLKKAIKVRAANKKKTIGVQVQWKKDNAYYGSFVEEGTKRQKAQHFLRKAADDEGQKATDVAIDKMKTGIEDLAK